MYVDLILPTLIMTFLAIIAVCLIVFPILFLIQRRKHHKELIAILKENKFIKNLVEKSK